MERTLAVEDGPATTTEPPVLELTGLRRDFGDRPALTGITARLELGESLAVLGPNGSGKSTLLRILAGLLRPSDGEGRVGYLGHEPLLYRDLTIRENLDLAAALHRLNPEQADIRIRTLLEDVGMAHRAHDRVAELSAGMKQRVDICRAVLHGPALLLLDEPDAHLDAEARHGVQPLIGAGEGRSRVIVSHDREAATAGADLVLELR
jgi:heme exporter protein A